MNPVRIVSAAIVLSSALAACGAGTHTEASGVVIAGAGAPPVVTTTEANESLYSLTMPAGWTKVSSEPGQPSIDRFEGADGRWFEVLAFNDADPYGSEFVADAVWALAYNEARDGLIVRQIGPMCEAGEPYCSTGDGTYQAYALLRDDQNASTVTEFVHHHLFQFDFGGPGESSSVADFRSMLETFHIN